jgi:hypothetical protein
MDIRTIQAITLTIIRSLITVTLRTMDTMTMDTMTAPQFRPAQPKLLFNPRSPDAAITEARLTAF